MNPAPNPIDVQDIQFKQSSIQQVSEEFTSTPIACSLIATDGKRGLIYVGHNKRLSILKLDANVSSEWKIELELPYTLCRLALSCDSSYLAVSTPTAGTLIYNAGALSKSSLELLQVILLSTQTETFVRDLQWNPTIPEMLCIVDSSTAIGNLQITGNKTMLTPGPAIDALCAAWSPKGKQIIVGCRNGDIVQFQPDFKLVRRINGPAPSIGEVIALKWISNYQFCAAYMESVERRINVLIVDAPKGEKRAVFTYYEDITYGMPDAEGADSLPRYYLEHIQEWNLIIAASSSSSEVALLGSTDNGTTWIQWTPGEGSRAELPLKSRRSHTESYPVGLAIDRTSVEKLPWGTDSTLPHPVPKLHIFGTSGQLCSFHIINLSPNCPGICTAPTEPVTMQVSRPSIVPSEISFSLPNATATSTPRLKQADVTTDRPKVVPAANLFGGVNGNETATSKNPVFSMPTETKQLPKTHENQFQTSNIALKATEKVNPVNDTTVPPQETLDKKDNDSAIDDSIRMRAYADEQNLFEKELRSRIQQQTWDCGTPEERAQLGQKCALMDEFLKELREATNSLSSDIAYLKALLLQTFAWVEETKSKNTVSSSITPRNHGDSAKVAELKRLYYYTQSQLSQATKVLDLEWSDQKAHERMKMKIPSSEYLYQTLMKHNKIIEEEKRKMEYLSKKWKMLNRATGISGLNNSMSNLRLTSSKTKVSSYSGDTDIIEARCKAIALRTLNFTYEKQMKLRNTLMRLPPRIIKPVNPSPIQDRLEATLSSLASSGTVTAEIKSKAEPPANKQIPTSKSADDKNKSQTPLASLTSIVARIGSSEGNNAQTPVMLQNKINSISNSFSMPGGNKFPQLDKKNTPVVTSIATTVTVSAPVTMQPSVTSPMMLKNKGKQEFSTFSQPVTSSSAVPGINAFPKVDSISFGTPSTKSQELGQTKLPPKELAAKSDTSSIFTTTTDSPKIDTNLFSNISLKDTVLSTGVLSPKTQSVMNDSLSTSSSTLKPADTSTTFSFATSHTVASLIKSPVTESATTLPSANAQVFSFASKPLNAFSFALKTHTAPTTPALSQGSLDMSGLSLRLQTPGETGSTADEKSTTTSGSTLPTSNFSFAKSPSSSTLSVFRVPPTTTPQSTPSTAPSILITPITTSTFSKSTDTAAVASPPFVGSSQVYSPTSSVFGGGTQQGTVVSAPLFGQATSTSTTTTGTVFDTVTSASVFGGSSTSPAFGGFSSTPATTTTTLSTSITTSIAAGSPAFSIPSKPLFGDMTKALSTAALTGTTTTSNTTITFGAVSPENTSTVASFDKVSISPATSNTQFPAAGTFFGRPAASTAATPFGESLKNTSVFGSAATTSTTTSIFGGTSSSTIFGGKASASTTPSVFGNSATSTSVFGAAQNESAFVNKTSPFGNVTSGSPSAAPNATVQPAGSPTGLASSQSAFGAAPTFGGKPVFGATSPMFGASNPTFGSGFGTTTFGIPTAPGGFGSPPSMGGGSPLGGGTMTKMFGDTTGSSTFESLAGQTGGLTFGSLAQKSPEQEKPPPFSGGSSFSSWR